MQADPFEEADFYRAIRPDGVRVLLPSIDDLIRTKGWAQRDKDMVDIRALEGLKAQRQS